MGAVHKISECFFEDSFSLIAIHSNLEDYALGYILNKNLNSNFKRAKKDLDVNQHISFPIFNWEDIENDNYWTLIANQSAYEENRVQDGLFANIPSYTIHHLIPEYKDVDYFIKIEQEDKVLEESALKLITDIPKIMTAYTIDTKNLKSKNNLIF